MKKKIVYISGSEVFSAADIRAAFDEVRNTLGLDSDTILFGVPIDAMCEKTESVDASVMIQPVATTQEMPKTEIAQTPDLSLESVQPVMQAKADIRSDEAIVKSAPESAPDSHIVPILSVLGGAPETQSVSEEPESDSVSEPDIDDILNDDMPNTESEKTLEELLETMTPLREDVHTLEISQEIDDTVVSDNQDDATLENLASEFAAVQDKMPAPKKSPERGKISKLKNILPFKKIKHDDSGIMGDLFGWAGIAANDDDFSMPGFFTGVAAKK